MASQKEQSINEAFTDTYSPISSEKCPPAQKELTDIQKETPQLKQN